MGPTLWNIVCDGQLRTVMPEGTELVAFADNLAIVAKKTTIDGLRRGVNLAADRVVSGVTNI